MNENVRTLHSGLTPDQALEKARELNPRCLLVSLVDSEGNHLTIHSEMNGPMLTFLTMSTQAQVSKFLTGGS